MFLQIKMIQTSRSEHSQILWRELQIDRTPDVYCMTRVTFGDASSPFLSMATVQKHAEDHKIDYPTAVKEVKENMYVDDVLSGSPNDDSALQLKDELCSLLSKGIFQLTKWASKSQTVMEATPLQERAPTLVPTTDPENMSDSTSWNTQDHVLTFTNGPNILSEEDPETKRSLISLYSRVFDPMGLLIPFLMISKFLLQELWARGLDWDESLHSDITDAWETWKHGLPDITLIKVPRWLLQGLGSVDKVELHGFGDASQKAYGSAVYLCAESQDGSRVSNLVIAKTWVAPAKRVTLPRLELLAAYITVRQLDYVICNCVDKKAKFQLEGLCSK